MKKLITTTFFVCIALISASAASYKLDNQAVDALFDNATETSISSLNLMTESAVNANSTMVSDMDDATKTVLIACIIDYVGLGAFGIHRHILGTSDNMWAVYTFTVCGIFGIVPFIDFWVLLIDGIFNENPGKYLDNEEFFMWA